jgi:hypothetical protein
MSGSRRTGGRRKQREEAERLARQDWFARELGATWVPDGHGVYRFVGEPETPEPVNDENETLDSTLLDETQASDERERPKEREPDPGRWWKRRA